MTGNPPIGAQSGLTRRIIPCLDVTAGRVVKGVNFVELVDAGDPVEIASRYNDQGADELTFLDITAVANPALVRDASNYHGSQCIVVAIDARKVSKAEEPARWEIFTHGGRQATGIDAIDWAKKMAEFGAGELLLTSMDRDGTKAGFDLDLTRRICDSVSIPVIASGGVGNLQHLADGVTLGGASAVLAASIFHYGEYTVRQAKAYMAERGIPVRSS